ncbi:Sec1-binding region of Mso1-domain-containing protein [Phaeosphaeriaceae sp. PMI808]|nr:Sec1-binding region of Mso1-domain-containing protein [Phaeosphaeriaceae sp. PMI808]
MSSYLNNLLTNTTSRYNNLRRQLLDSETDGDTEDDSHISRVLRAYYTEKGRPFPQWLPPDPKGPQPAPAQFASSSGRQQGQAPPMGGRGGGLSDLWDSPQQQPPPQEPLSLRRGVGGRGGGGGGGGGARPLHGRPGMGNSLTPEPQSQGRPLPSQRAGSYQSNLGQGGRQHADASPPPSAGSGSTAQERLKARLWGRSNSPAQSAPSDMGSQSSSRMGSYERPAPQSDYRSNNHGSGGGGGRQQSSQGMSSNSPWVGNDDPYGPGYDSGPPGRGPPGGRVGLPSGPRMR